jgi:nucleoside 2-deoxyribosyltransferase
MMVYLAHPIDLGGEGTDALAEVHRVLDDLGITAYDPEQAWTVRGRLSTECAQALTQANMDVIGHCDVLIAVMDRPSIGVPVEMVYAAQRGVAVAAYRVPGMQHSLFLRGIGVALIDDPSILKGWLSESIEG